MLRCGWGLIYFFFPQHLGFPQTLELLDYKCFLPSKWECTWWGRGGWKCDLQPSILSSTVTPSVRPAIPESKSMQCLWKAKPLQAALIQLISQYWALSRVGCISRHPSVVPVRLLQSPVMPAQRSLQLFTCVPKPTLGFERHCRRG